MRLKILTFFIAFNLMTLGVFGFLGIGSMDHAGHHSCPISLVAGNSCPSVDGGLAMAIHHVSGMQNIIQSVLNTDLSLSILFALLFFSLLIFFRFLSRVSTPQIFYYQTYYKSLESNFLSRKQFLRWLVLHHKRDPYSILLGA